MQKKGGKKPRRRDRAQALQAAPESQPTSGAAASGGGSALDTLKHNLSGKRKAIFEILEDVKKVKPEQWQDPKHVEQMAKNFADRLGLPVPEQRIKQFVNAYKDATKNGPTANVDELVHKYGQNVDDKTLKEIKKFVPKNVK
ncbi:hypothetical protein [Alicyclobacillus shizuokensis]|uniref:hypothetical protein n=1 Tax=Alicyclobacillus shizuokensis TaxID=392014 RepID=UPI00082D2DB4|nr:hypothetical protein [Alicyclobacillus shizuokensis]